MTSLPLQLTDQPDLLTRSRAGDEAAFTALVGAFQPMVYRWALALSGDADAAEDITQETFVRVYRKLSAFRGDGSFEGWLYRITRRVALRSRPRFERYAGHEAQDVYLTDPGARVDRERAVGIIQSIAATLPVRQREVFMLCDLEGRTSAEAAAMLGMKDVSVRASLFKARASIRRTILATHPCYTEQPR